MTSIPSSNKVGGKLSEGSPPALDAATTSGGGVTETTVASSKARAATERLDSVVGVVVNGGAAGGLGCAFGGCCWRFRFLSRS